MDDDELIRLRIETGDSIYSFWAERHQCLKLV